MTSDERTLECPLCDGTGRTHHEYREYEELLGEVERLQKVINDSLALFICVKPKDAIDTLRAAAIPDRGAKSERPGDEATTPSCDRGESCRDWLTCDESCEYGRGSVACMLKHQQHVCAHDFRSGPWVTLADGGSASCRCGLTACAHDMRYAP